MDENFVGTTGLAMFFIRSASIKEHDIVIGILRFYILSPQVLLRTHWSYCLLN